MTVKVAWRTEIAFARAILSGAVKEPYARLAGVFYLLTIIGGVFAEVFVRGRLVVRNDAAATATNILANEPLYRLGLVADLVMLASYVAVTLLLYLLLEPVSRPLALLALRLHSRVYTIAGVFFRTYCVLVGRLVFRSGFLPRAIGVVMAIGGVNYLVHIFTIFLWPAAAARLPDVTIVGGLAELSLTLSLVFAGRKRRLH
jgi:Domain of unknown function (DUF4386)